MEKQPTKSKGSNLFKYLQRPASFAVPRLPSSPGRRRRAAFSGPILHSTAPNTKKKKQPGTPKEPSSPKVSCIGQIKKHKKAADTSCKDGLCMRRPPLPPKPEKPRGSYQMFGLKKMFRSKVRPSKKHEEDQADADVEMGTLSAAPAPMLGQMRRFTSKREGLGSFDWRKTQTVEEEEEEDEDVQEKAMMISYSGPILMGGGEVAVEPKKEVNIWKRRTAAPPKPLQLN